MSIQNIRRSVIVAVGIGVLAVGGLFAGRLFAHQMDHGLGSGGAGPQHMFARIARHLDLTDAQQAQIRAVLKTHADQIEAHVKAGMDARRALHDAIVAQPADEAAIRGLALQLGTAQGDGAVLFAKIRAEVWPILSADQQQKFLAFHGKMRQHGDDAMKSLGTWLRSDS